MLNAHRIKYTCNRSQELSNAGSGEGKGWLGERISSLQLRMEIPGVMERNGAKNINCVNNNMIVHVVQMIGDCIGLVVIFLRINSTAEY